MVLYHIMNLCQIFIFIADTFNENSQTHSTEFSFIVYLINHRFHTQESDKFECNATRKTIKCIDSRTKLPAVTQFRSYLTPCITFRLSVALRGREVPRATHRVRTVRGTYCGSCHLYLPNPIFRFVPRCQPAFSAISRGTRKQARRYIGTSPPLSTMARFAMHIHIHMHCARTLGAGITDWI